MRTRPKVLKDRPAPPLMVEDAIEAILVYFTALEAPINEQDLLDRSRDHYTVKVRALVMFFLKTECHWSYLAIGKRLERDHTSVISMVRRVHHLVDDEEIADLFEYVKERVQRSMASRRDTLLASVDVDAS